MRRILAAAFTVLVAACASTPEPVLILADVKDSTFARQNQTVGTWAGDALALVNPEENGRIVTRERYRLPLSRNDVQGILDWIKSVQALDCGDGAVFRPSSRELYEVNVLPENEALRVSMFSLGSDTRPTDPAPVSWDADVYHFQEEDGEFACTHMSKGGGHIIVTT